MRRIIDVLTIEHTVLCTLFSEIDDLLPKVRTVDEVRLLSRLVEGVLSHHADVEENLAFAALDHVLAEKHQLGQLHQDHEEIDACLRNAGSTTELTKAVQMLKAGLEASRAHFRQEEQAIFPLFEKLLAPTTLETLAAGVSITTSAQRPQVRAAARHAR